jgi:ATP-binding cassette subfamily C (CFTR/MRP) protein 4
MYAKVSRLTSFTAKSAELGKIINLLSSDFNSIETKLPFIMAGLIFPFALIGGTIIICLRVGWGGIFTFIVPLVVFPIVIFISKKIKDFILKINVSKDGRIKLCSEIIEGIKFIKLYGWEMAFKKKIQLLRESEIAQFIYLAVGRSFEKSISNSVAYFSGFFIFLVADYMNTLTV